MGLHPRLHHLGMISKMLYSTRDVGPAGISRLVAMPRLFQRLPRWFQDRTAYRAIRPAGAGWLKPRLKEVTITLGRRVAAAKVAGSRLLLKLDDGTERLVDHVLLATGFRVDVSKYPFLAQSLEKRQRLPMAIQCSRKVWRVQSPGYISRQTGGMEFWPLARFCFGDRVCRERIGVFDCLPKWKALIDESCSRRTRTKTILCAVRDEDCRRSRGRG